MRVLGGTLALLLAAGKVRALLAFLRTSSGGWNWHIGEMSEEGRGKMDATLPPCVRFRL